ncbi:uncharacterized protein ARMOST_15711 [Armillaria ostoyae]|uniref:Uncharacterized protein n=1 Tax=Armillaria ostoyae TaxID=47428 RepID=A0A284RU41_ARMOS|nr:uncharacterized protein ARMOST_15711 [Armillaria ostoyae]
MAKHLLFIPLTDHHNAASASSLLYYSIQLLCRRHLAARPQGTSCATIFDQQRNSDLRLLTLEWVSVRGEPP